MARRSIRDLIRRKSRGRKAMTSDMRGLIESFDAHRPATRPAYDQAAESDDSPTSEQADDSDRPSRAADSA